MSDRLDLLQGTLDLLILKTLALGAMHGYAVARRISDVTRDTLRIEEGSLYPSLHRMERKGWVAAEWGTSENNRKAKYYRLTLKGRRQLESRSAQWSEFVTAVTRVLQTE